MSNNKCFVFILTFFRQNANYRALVYPCVKIAADVCVQLNNLIMWQLCHSMITRNNEIDFVIKASGFELSPEESQLLIDVCYDCIHLWALRPQFMPALVWLFPIQDTKIDGLWPWEPVNEFPDSGLKCHWRIISQIMCWIRSTNCYIWSRPHGSSALPPSLLIGDPQWHGLLPPPCIVHFRSLHGKGAVVNGVVHSLATMPWVSACNPVTKV